MKTNQVRRKQLPIAISLATMFAGAVSLPALAAETASASAGYGIEEVIITARKTEESQQSVPVSVTALSAKDLQASAVLSVQDLQTNMTGLVVAPNSQGGAPTFSIRGAKEDNGTGAKVSIYIDDVPVWSTLSAAHMMYDLSSVDTLKGPQGTLFGANSTAGAIVFRPNKPTDKFEGYAEVGIGNWKRQAFQGMINLPISDTVQLRIAGEMVDREGFQKNLSPGKSPSRLNDEDYESARVTLRIKPSTTFTNDILVDYFHKDQQPNQQVTVRAINSYAGATLYDPESRTVNMGSAGPIGPGLAPGCGAYNTCAPTWDKAKTWGIQDVATWEVNDDITFKNVLAYRKDQTDTYEHDASFNVTSISGRTAHDSEKWSEEASLHINSMDKRLRTQVGVFLDRQKLSTGNSYSLFWLPSLGALGPLTPAMLAAFPAGALPVPLLQDNFYTREFKSHAIYAQSSFDLTKELTATLGLRYSWDSGNYTIHPLTMTGSGGNVFGGTAVVRPNATLTGGNPVLVNPTGDFFLGGNAACNWTGSVSKYDSPNQATCTGYKSMKSQAPSFNFTIEDKYAERSMIYASLRGGYIRGGFNNNAPVPQNQTFKPEKVVDFEVGVKSDWELWGRPIRTNFDVFYGNYKNLQTSQVGSYIPAPGSAPVTYIAVFNAGASTFYGHDLEVKYQPTESIDLAFSWTHLEAEFTNFCGVLPINSQGCIDLSGEAPGQTPKDTVSASATVKWPLSSEVGSVSSTLTYFWRDKTMFRDVPTINLAGPDYLEYDKMPAFDLFNFTTDWKNIMGSQFDAQFWVKNLMDKTYVIYGSNQLYLSGLAGFTYGPPREIGLNLRYNF